jgi:hypothetical protein
LLRLAAPENKAAFPSQVVQQVWQSITGAS